MSKYINTLCPLFRYHNWAFCSHGAIWYIRVPVQQFVLQYIWALLCFHLYKIFLWQAYRVHQLSQSQELKWNWISNYWLFSTIFLNYDTFFCFEWNINHFRIVSVLQLKSNFPSRHNKSKKDNKKNGVKM